MDRPEEIVDFDSLKEVISFLDSLGRPYCLHAGTALHFYGFESDIDDIDIKVFHEDIQEVFKEAQQFFGDKAVFIQDGQRHFGSYLFPGRIEVDLKTPIDICTHTGAKKADLGEVEFPFNKEMFANVTHIEREGIKLPLASLESLFLYYLVLRRGSLDGKNDEYKIRNILSSGKFNEQKFFTLLEGHPRREAILALYRQYLVKEPVVL